MSGDRDTDTSEGHPRYALVITVVAATLTLLAAIIGLITVLVDDDGGSSTTPPTSVSTGNDGSGGGGDTTGGSGGGNEGSPPNQPRDGTSRASAKPLFANQPFEGTISAGNDVDWYVYEVPKEETATVEFVKGGEFVAIPTTLVTIYEGIEVLEWETLQSTSYPLVVKRIVSPGTSLYVEVVNECEAGCGLGPYEVVVRTGPPD